MFTSAETRRVIIRASLDFNFSSSNTIAGITSSTRSVAKESPKQMVIAMGLVNMVSDDDSNNKGVSPATVVTDVNRTALNRD